MSKTIEDLREHLFAAIAGVKNGTVSLEQAKTIGDLSQVVVNTAKVEVDYLRATEAGESSFIGAGVKRENLPQMRVVGPPGNGIAGITRHICKDE
jgi:hypothetical protein